jgi:hypothetical protein
MIKEYRKIDGKVYEVMGRNKAGLICKLVPGLKDIPEDKPLKAEAPAQEEVVAEAQPEVTEAPVKRRRRRTS